MRLVLVPDRAHHVGGIALVAAVEDATQIARPHHPLRETPYEANRFLSLCSKVFNLAEQWGLEDELGNRCSCSLQRMPGTVNADGSANQQVSQLDRFPC